MKEVYIHMVGKSTLSPIYHMIRLHLSSFSPQVIPLKQDIQQILHTLQIHLCQTMFPSRSIRYMHEQTVMINRGCLLQL